MEEVAASPTPQDEPIEAEPLSGLSEVAGDSISPDEFIDFAFTEYIDFGIDMLVRAGMREADALNVIFEIATELAHNGVLPTFPDDTTEASVRGEWLVAAAKTEFYNLLIETIGED